MGIGGVMQIERRWLFAGVAAVASASAMLAWLATDVGALAPLSAQAQSLPTSIADLKPTEQDDRLVLAPPTIGIRPEGALDVAFDTAVPTPACRLYVGVLNPSTALDTPFFPAAVKETLKEPATSHRLAASVKSVESWWPKADASGLREGDVYVRLELYDSRTGAARYFETRFHAASMKGQYEKRPSIVLGPVVDQVTTTSVLVSWNADQPVAGRVELWSATEPGQKIADFKAAPSLHPVVTVNGLKAGARYRYRVLLADPGDGRVVHTGKLYPFRAAVAAGTEFKFVFESDGRASLGGAFANFNGVNADVTPKLFADGYRRGAHFGVFAGDLVNGPTSSVENQRMMFSTWKHVNDPVAHSMPIYEGMGNHEGLQRFYLDAANVRYATARVGDGSAEAEFAAHFVNPGNGPQPETRDGVTGPPYKGVVYSFDYGNSHFVMLDSDYWFTNGGASRETGLVWKLLGGNREGYLMANQLAWLEQDLAAARKRGLAHVFVMQHEPPLPIGGHAGDGMWWRGLNDPAQPSGDVVAMRDRYLTILSKYGVVAVLAGHEHVYGRLQVDGAVAKAVTKPFVQIVSGGAGAPFYAQDENVPWAKSVQSFASTYHYLLITVSGPRVTFEAIGLDGRVFDSGVIR